MNNIQVFFEYLVEHPGSTRLLGIIGLTLITLPYIILWARVNQVRRIRKAYDSLITDQTDTITSLYRNIMEVQGNLAKTRGELDQKIAELKNKKINLDSALDQIKQLKQRISVLEVTEKNLMLKIKEYEKLS